MPCKSCNGTNQREIYSEIAVHGEVRTKLGAPHLLIFPKLLVCLNCGFVEFTLHEAALRHLAASPDSNPQVKGQAA